MAPIVAISVVLWFLLPGSVAGLTYTPNQYFREAHLQPEYWSTHRATVRGYVYLSPSCGVDTCPSWILLDEPLPRDKRIAAQRLTSGVIVLAQHESKWHRVLRDCTPGLLAKPFPADIQPGRRVSVTGRLRTGYTGIGTPVLLPDDL
jgi:hypothetical protein